ncbi:MAG: hypothetical protein KBC56_08680 [Flavobacterium sp.]|nr:hypothetical protein [Flavobacterium sp.]
MSATNPQQYYETPESHGNYQFVILEDLVNNFILAYTGDDSVIGIPKRRNVLYWMKQGIKQFSFSALQGVKKIELELGDTLDIIKPPDYVDYVRISWLDMKTGLFRPMSVNQRVDATAISYLQDNLANILFDDEGEILEGMSGAEIVNNSLTPDVLSNTELNSGTSRCYRLWTEADRTIWNLDTSVNYNGSFSIDNARIHFSSNVASNIIILEYLSDGLESLLESEIKINKKAEIALYDYVKWNLMTNKIGVQDYKVRQAERDYRNSFRDARIKMAGLRVADITQRLKLMNMWFKG